MVLMVLMVLIVWYVLKAFYVYVLLSLILLIAKDLAPKNGTIYSNCAIFSVIFLYTQLNFFEIQLSIKKNFYLITFSYNEKVIM